MDERFQEIYLNHLARSTDAIERLADRFAPAAPPVPATTTVPATEGGDAGRGCVKCTNGIDRKGRACRYCSWKPAQPQTAKVPTHGEKTDEELLIEMLDAEILFVHGIKGSPFYKGGEDSPVTLSLNCGKFGADSEPVRRCDIADVYRSWKGGKTLDWVASRRAAPQPPVAEGGTMESRLGGVISAWARRFNNGGCSIVGANDIGMLLDDVMREAQAAALPAGAVEALREWQQLHRERQLRVLESVGDISAEAFALLDALAVAGKGA